ncbi:MAG: rod shape-determining protein [Eubacteriales bacterium]|nr:rod shape-determining protein [Eubacteriales bacterium]
MDIALDLGTCNTRILTKEKGKVLDEPTVITYDAIDNRILAAGEDAYKMLGKTPSRIHAVYPLEGGVIAELDLVEEMIDIFLSQVSSSKVVMPRVVACIPGEITEVEKRAVVNAISSFGVRRVYLIESAKAAAMGAGLDIMSPHGSMIADIGGGTADIAVMSLGGVSVSTTIKNAGKLMDEEIVKYVRRKYSLIIGNTMAEQCKKAIGCVVPPKEEKAFRVKGRDSVRGLPRYVDMKSSEVYEAIAVPALEIVKGFLEVLEKTPPELIGDIYTDGITLTGSLAQLDGFCELISHYTQLSVRIADSPADCVVNGCGKAIAYIADVENNTGLKVNPLLAAY